MERLNRKGMKCHCCSGDLPSKKMTRTFTLDVASCKIRSCVCLFLMGARHEHMSVEVGWVLGGFGFGVWCSLKPKVQYDTY